MPLCAWVLRELPPEVRRLVDEDATGWVPTPLAGVMKQLIEETWETIDNDYDYDEAYLYKEVGPFTRAYFRLLNDDYFWTTEGYWESPYPD